MNSREVRRVAGAIAHHKKLVVAVIGTMMALAYVSATLLFPKPNGRIVVGDATHHFMQLRSLVFDHDVDFLNEHLRIYGLQHTEGAAERIRADLGTPTGLIRNFMPVGPALLWAPLYLLVVGVERLIAATGHGMAPDGFSAAAQLAPGLSGIFAASAGAWLAWRTAERLTGPTSAAVGTLTVWLGSHALYYSLVSPTYSHAASMLTSALFVSCWLGDRVKARSLVRRAATLGALAGAGALMRWQDALFLTVVWIEVLASRAPWRTQLVALFSATVAALLVFSPQMLVWAALYGQPFALPQGSGFLRWSAPHPVAVLFSDNHGLFTWAPVLGIACWGLVGFARRVGSVAFPLAVLVGGTWYVNAAVTDWWGGEAFGGRRFLSLFPLFVVGLSAWLDRGTRNSDGALQPRLMLCALCVLANALLLLQYQLALKGLEHVAPYPHGWFDMWLVRFLVPLRLATWWAS